MSRLRLRKLDLAALVLLLALALIATRSVWLEIIRIGLSSEEQSHILLAPLVAVWLAYLRRARLRYCRMSPSLLGPVIILLGWTMSAAGFQLGIDLAWHLGALLIVAGSLITVVGPSCLRHFMPVALAMLFVLPIPGRIRQEVAVPLQQITARVGQGALELMGFGVQRMGNVLEVNGHQVAVAEACNGMRMVSALALIAFAFVFSTPMRNSVRILILAATPLLAILVNLVRMVPTVLLYAYAETDLADLFHDLSGWASLLIALGLLWCMLGALRWLEVPIARVAVAESPSRA